MSVLDRIFSRCRPDYPRSDSPPTFVLVLPHETVENRTGVGSFSSSTDRKHRSAGRGCAATRAASSPWAVRVVSPLGALDAAVWDKLRLGLSTRHYGRAVRQFAAAYGIEKSAVSDHFIRVSRGKLRELIERPLDQPALCAIYIDEVEYHSQHLVVALGVAVDRRKIVLGLQQGATENAVVTGELLADLEQRGVDFTQPRLYILDGTKALGKALKKQAGKAALIQRCQIHKRRNVAAHLPDEYRESIDRKLANAIR